MIQTISIEQIWLPAFSDIPTLDIRSPKEYEKGHIPGAVSLPLFCDDERSVIGTLYHKEGRQAAILKGFDITGPKWSALIRQALEIAPGQRVILHCWRGGMRSDAMAWALSLYGFDVFIIKGGYKSFRRWCYRQFSRGLPLVVLAGKTGANKTGILKTLSTMGEQVVDLEALACHQGSAYGSLGRLTQPTQEQFENQLASVLKDVDLSRTVWIEDESLTIGRNAIPQPLWQQLVKAPALTIEVPVEQRVEILHRQYGSLDKDFLTEATLKIRKRLGPDRTAAAIKWIQEGDMRAFIRQVLTYYDKAYLKSNKNAADKPWTDVLTVNDIDDGQAVARQLLRMAAAHGEVPIKR